MASYHFTVQFGEASIMVAILLCSVIFLAAFVVTVIQYRKRTSNITTAQAALFYFTLKCCKTKQILDTYE